MAMKYGEDFEPIDASPEEKAMQLADMKLNLGGCLSPSCLLAWAEGFDCVTELLQAEEAAYLVQFYTLLNEIRRLIRIDNKDQFASFLRTNHDLVHKFPANDVLKLLCWRSAVGCAAALLEDSHLLVDITFIFDCGMTPLHLAAYKLSYAMTKLLLHHGADPDSYVPCRGTPLETALSAISHKSFEGWTSQKSILQLFYSFCAPELKEPFDTVKLLASHSKNVEDLCFQLMNAGGILHYAPLLMVAWDKLMVSSTEGGLETTPVGQHISRVLSNASLLQELCERSVNLLSKEILVKNLTIALDVAKTMWMIIGVHDHWSHSRVENVPMYGLPFNITRELMKAAGSGDNKQCLPHKFTSEAEVLPKRNFFVEQGRPVPILRSFTWRPKTSIGTSRYRSPSSFQYRSFHLPETAQVKPSSCNSIALTRVCASLMWFAKRIVR